MLSDGFHDVPAGKLAMVVTYLEMTSAPPLRERTLPEGVEFVQVTPTLAWYRDVFSRVGARDWLWYGRLKLSDAELGAILADPNIAFFTLRRDGVDEALLELDFREGGACELAYFGLTSALIGTGSGRYLMNEAISRAFARDITRFHVHTCTLDSAQALAFYVRSGFSPYRRAVEVDDDPRQTGLLPPDTAAAIPVI